MNSNVMTDKTKKRRWVIRAAERYGSVAGVDGPHSEDATASQNQKVIVGVEDHS
jgi:hypothetical protein